MQASLPLISSPGRTDGDELNKELEVDYTPPAVALQLLLALDQTLRDMGIVWTPYHALAPAAGSGCWPRAMRAAFPDMHITGIDARASEADNLAAACDAYGIGDALADDGPTRGRMFDLIADNPPFSAFGHPDSEGRRRFWPVEFARHHKLTSGGLVLMYGLTQWGQAEDHAAYLAAWRPFLQLRCGGRPQHRGVGTMRRVPIPEKRRKPGGPTHELRENGGDSREYCAWVWRRRDFGASARRPSWLTVQLPVLPHELRVWHPSAVPGTYPIEPALVAEVRRYV